MPTLAHTLAVGRMATVRYVNIPTAAAGGISLAAPVVRAQGHQQLLRRRVGGLAASPRLTAQRCRAASEPEAPPSEAPALKDQVEEEGASVSAKVEPPQAISKPLYGFVALLSALGVGETAYLTWLKLSGSTPGLCNASGSCQSVLDSKYGELLGVPLPAWGLGLYTIMMVLALEGLLAEKAEVVDQNKQDSLREGLQGCAAAAATTSLYLMLTLSTKLDGASCVYCYTSATLSTAILLSTLPGWKKTDFASGAGVMMAVILSLGYGYGDLSVYATDSAQAEQSSQEIELPYKQPIVETTSTPEYIGLAKHLKATGAKFYGAFWCSHCFDQKTEFGAEAQADLPYVECFPEGYRRGIQIEASCKAANVQGFPTWVIDGKKYEGDLTFEELSDYSKYKP